MEIYNFSPGPAMLPKAVLAQAREEFQSWHNKGVSAMEMSHRSAWFLSIAEQAESDLRHLLSVPDGYYVLFLQGGASSQFAMVPMNLLSAQQPCADYLDTGLWSAKAITEASRYGRVHVVASSREGGYKTIPPCQEWQFSPRSDYVHYTPNETINGVEFQHVPDIGKSALVADMSSTILSRPLAVERFGLIYAGAQKNIGPAGLTVVIVRADLLQEPLPATPTMYDYRAHAKAGSMLNTPPTYSLYLAGLVFRWLREQGGLAAMAKINQHKADTLYRFIDQSDFYSNPVDPSCRSWMNVPFILADPSRQDAFLETAKKAGLLALKGHRSVGGMRASIYNAMPQEGVDALVECMREFARLA